MTDPATMPAGEAFDRLVWSVVMGRAGTPPVGDAYHHEGGWAPSTDIAQAWEVVERMRLSPPPSDEHHYAPWFAIAIGNGEDVSPEQWTAGWRTGADFDGEWWEVRACAPTVPLAICRAALIAAQGARPS